MILKTHRSIHDLERNILSLIKGDTTSISLYEAEILINDTFKYLLQLQHRVENCAMCKINNDKEKQEEHDNY